MNQKQENNHYFGFVITPDGSRVDLVGSISTCHMTFLMRLIQAYQLPFKTKEQLIAYRNYADYILFVLTNHQYIVFLDRGLMRGNFGGLYLPVDYENTLSLDQCHSLLEQEMELNHYQKQDVISFRNEEDACEGIYYSHDLENVMNHCKQKEKKRKKELKCTNI